MIELILVAAPFFLLFVAIEVASLWLAPDDDEVGYDLRDTATSLTMGLGSVVVGLGYKALALAVYSGAYLLTPLRVDPGHPAAWIVIFFLDDLCYYWYHRAHHEVRLLWASHVVHHSSQRYNFSTALRQTWTPFGALPFWLPLALLGFPPWMILLQQSVNLVYQFFLHTERIDKLPRPVELVMNTPSHHRVHHGSNAAYLDRNYGGILVVWDRLFRTFEAEGERVVYGLTRNLRSHNPLVVAFHEYAAIVRDLGSSPSWRARWSFVVRGPGWRPQSG